MRHFLSTRLDLPRSDILLIHHGAILRDTEPVISLNLNPDSFLIIHTPPGAIKRRPVFKSQPIIPVPHTDVPVLEEILNPVEKSKTGPAVRKPPPVNLPPDIDRRVASVRSGIETLLPDDQILTLLKKTDFDVDRAIRAVRDSVNAAKPPPAPKPPPEPEIDIAALGRLNFGQFGHLIKKYSKANKVTLMKLILAHPNREPMEIIQCFEFCQREELRTREALRN
jgi:hypothetical protein